MDISVNISSLLFSSGDSISLEPDSIVVFVGPNSSGKTQSIKDIWSRIATPRQPSAIAIKDLTIQKIGTNDQYLAFLQQHSIVRNNHILLPGLTLSPATALNKEWEKDSFSHIGQLLANLVEADDRFSAIKQRKRINRSEEKTAHPLPALDLDTERERNASDSFHAVFGKHLMLDRGAGSVVNLHVGDRPDPVILGGEYSSAYCSEVRKRPDIISEGDGLRAAAGLFLNILSAPKCIFLIDEPDVYLHPPQAYAAAKEITNACAGKQLFMATHNSHFVRGLLDTNSQRVILVRLDRSDTTQSVCVIENTVLGEIDSDPLVRFSNLLEAMFFRTAIICENEADCLFYRNLCRVVDQDSRDDDVFWLSAHGKQNIRKFSSILGKLGLRVISIPDLDVINNETCLRLLLESHGGKWSDVQQDFDTLTRLMKERKPTTSSEDVKMEIGEILDTVTPGTDGLFPSEAARRIRVAMNRASPWREVKESGVKALGKGKNQVAAKNLIRKLRDRGILVPPVGEMESFYPLSGAHGVEWVNEVLRLDVKNDERLFEARQFAKRIISVRS